MAEAARRHTRVALSYDDLKILRLEPAVNDLADLALLLSDSAEKWIDVSADSKCAKQHFESIPENERKALIFGIYKVARMSRDLLQNYYAAIHSGETSHAES